MSLIQTFIYETGAFAMLNAVVPATETSNIFSNAGSGRTLFTTVEGVLLINRRGVIISLFLLPDINFNKKIVPLNTTNT